MPEYEEMRIYQDDTRTMRQVENLLAQEGIQKDKNLEYTMGIFIRDELIATGSFFRNTLRCLAVDGRCRGEGLLNKVVTHLMEVQYQRGNLAVFLYTKCDTAKFFKELGFYEIARVEGLVVFMENRPDGFKQYLKNLAPSRIPEGKSAAVIVNANPFTLGHQYLIEQAARDNDRVHVFVVSEDISLVPFDVRQELVRQGTAHLKNVMLHTTGSYLISSATFPSYFLQDDDTVIRAQAQLDIEVFKGHIAKTLGITRRYVGEEPTSRVTGLYNKIMQQELKKNGIECIVMPRKQVGDVTVSASLVRQYIKNGELEKAKALVPETTYEFFLSAAGKKIIQRIQESQQVVHY